jgi:hypothetical protein
MDNEDIQKLIDLGYDLYKLEQKKSGMITPIPFAWVQDLNGTTIYVVPKSIHSKGIEESMKKIGFAALA